jgi:hypothetical protein
MNLPKTSKLYAFQFNEDTYIYTYLDICMSWIQVIPGVTLTKVTLLNNFLLNQYSAETKQDI